MNTDKEVRAAAEGVLKHGRVFEIYGKYFSDKGVYFMCDECCNGDRCDTPSHYLRKECPYCLGTGINKTAQELNAYHKAMIAAGTAGALPITRHLLEGIKAGIGVLATMAKKHDLDGAVKASNWVESEIDAILAGKQPPFDKLYNVITPPPASGVRLWREVTIEERLPKAGKSQNHSIPVSAYHNDNDVWIFGYFWLPTGDFYQWERIRGAGVLTKGITHWLEPIPATCTPPASKDARQVAGDAWDAALELCEKEAGIMIPFSDLIKEQYLNQHYPVQAPAGL